jgi:hypothetical protein
MFGTIMEQSIIRNLLILNVTWEYLGCETGEREEGGRMENRALF